MDNEKSAKTAWLAIDQIIVWSKTNIWPELSPSTCFPAYLGVTKLMQRSVCTMKVNRSNWVKNIATVW